MRITTFLAVLFAAALASAQVYPPDSSGGAGAGYDGGAVSNPFLAPTGCGSTPGYAFDGRPSAGFCSSAADTVGWVVSDGNGLFTATRHNATWQLGSNTGDVVHNWNPTSNLGETPRMYFGTGPFTFSITNHLGAAFTMSEDAAALFTFPGPILLTDGISANKALARTGEVDNGIYFMAGKQILETGVVGSARSYLLLDGTNGIGSPTSTWHVIDDGGTDLVQIQAEAYGEPGFTIQVSETGSTTTYTQNPDNFVFSDPLLAPDTGYQFSSNANQRFYVVGGSVRVAQDADDPENYITISDTAINLETGEDDNADYASITITEGVSIDLNVDDDQGTGTNANILISASSDLIRLEVDDQTNSGQINVTPVGLDIVDNGTQPTCTSAERGVLWLEEGGAGVPDTFEVCAKNTSDTYAWYGLATIP